MSLIEKRPYSEDLAPKWDAATTKKARIPAALGYLFFPIPLIWSSDSKFGYFHANQALLLFFMIVVSVMVMSLISNLVGFIIAMLIVLYVIVFSVRGFILALSGKAKRAPLIGKFIIIEYDHFYKYE